MHTCTHDIYVFIHSHSTKKSSNKSLIELTTNLREKENDFLLTFKNIDISANENVISMNNIIKQG